MGRCLLSNKKTLVKICGLKDSATISAMSGLPVDYIGFVFAPSKRQVTAAQAAKLHAAVQAAPMRNGKPARTVGVFVNPTIDELADVLAQVRLDVVQLHGRESPSLCREISRRFSVEIWRVLSIRETGGGDREATVATGVHAVRPRNSEHIANSRPAASDLNVEAAIAEYKGIVSTILLDTAGGGTGRTFRWEQIPGYQAAARKHGLRLFVAGGLAPDNVAGLIREYAPDGVDVSSGVETGGVKDVSKIATFAERVNRS